MENIEEGRELKRVMGLFDAVIYGIGGMIGAGIFVLSGYAIEVAGPSAILSFLLCGLVASFTGLVYAELSSMFPEAGGGYSFIKRVFSGYLGFLSGWLLWAAYTISAAFYAFGFGAFLSLLVEGDIWSMALAIAVLFTALNIVGTKSSSRTQRVIVVGKILILILFALLSLPKIKLNAFENFFSNGILATLIASSQIFIAFQGYDIISTTSEELKDPRRNLPKAIILSIIITTTIYIGVVVALVGLQDYWIGKGLTETAIAVATSEAIGPWMYMVIIIGALIATSSALNSAVFAASRVLYAMGRQGDAPRSFSKISRRHGTPTMSLLGTFIVIAFIILLFGKSEEIIETLGAFSSIVFLLCFALVDLSYIKLKTTPSKALSFNGGEKLFKAPLFSLTPILGIISSIILIASCNINISIGLFLFIVLTSCFYILKKLWLSRVEESFTHGSKNSF